MDIPFKKTLASASTAILLVACGGSSSSVLFTDAEKTFVKNLFLTEYLWYDQVDDSIDPLQFSTPQSLIYAFRVNPPDRWSFSITKQAYLDYSNQKTSGFGFGYQADFRIFVVLIDSPAYGKLQRGDIILKVNGQRASTTAIQAASESLGSATTFVVQREDQEITVTVTPSEYTHKVTLSKIITHEDKQIGYLRYDAFTSSSITEIEEAFDTLHQHSIDELVIDLRYNGGGSVETASVLMDNITNAYPGQRQLYLDWNDRYKHYNESYFFEGSDKQDGNELDMQRVYFLVTEHSASASELVINALKPYLGESNVITIGDYTHGKPVGMSGRSYGDNYYFLINFIVRNDDGDTVPFSGIAPTCSAIDDITHVMGDPEESSLATALYHIVNNQCPTSAKMQKSTPAIQQRSPLGLQGLWTTPSPSHDWQNSY